MDETSTEIAPLPFVVKPGKILSKENIENVTREVGPDFVPETFFVRAADKEGKPTNYIVQKRLKGEMKPLHEVSDEELNDPEIASQLLRFVNGVITMEEATGKIPDMFGRPIDPLSPRFYNPRYADNICLVEDEFGGKEIYLTDIGAITEHAEKTHIHHKISMRLIRRSLRKFKKRLEKTTEQASEAG